MVYPAYLCVWCPWSYLVYFMSWVWLYLIDTSQMSRPVSHCLERTRSMDRVTTQLPPLCSDQAEHCFCFTHLTFYPIQIFVGDWFLLLKFIQEIGSLLHFLFPAISGCFQSLTSFSLAALKCHRIYCWTTHRVPGVFLESSVFSWVWYQRCHPIGDYSYFICWLASSISPDPLDKKQMSFFVHSYPFHRGLCGTIFLMYAHTKKKNPYTQKFLAVLSTKKSK